LKKGFRILALLLFILPDIFCNDVNGQEVSESENLFVTVFTNEHGLRQSMVSQVCQDSRGLIWMVTGDGLHYFDGQEFKAFRVPYNNVYNHTDNVMRYVTGNGPDQLLLASSSSLLQFNTGKGQFKIIYRKEGIYPIIFNTGINGQPLVWIAGLNLCCVQGDKLLPLHLKFENNAAMPAGFVPTQSIDLGQGNLLMSGETGLVEIQTEGCISATSCKAKWFPMAACQGVAKSQSGDVVVFAGGKLYSRKRNGDLLLISDTKLGGMFNLFIDSRDNIWLMDKNHTRLYRSARGELKEVKLCALAGIHPEELSVNVISIFEDSEHNLWFGTDGNGVLLYSPGQVQFHRADIGFVRCISIFNDKVWAGTFNNGLWELSRDLGSSKRVNPSQFDNSIYFLDFAADKNERLWMATRTGLKVVDREGHIVWEYPLNCSQAKFITGGVDSLLLICDNRLLRFRTSEKPVCYSTGNYIATRAFLTVGDFYWVAGPYGLYRYNKSVGFVRGTMEEWNASRIDGNPVYDIIQQKGFIWEASGNGLLCFYPDGRKRALSASFSALGNDVIYSIVPDARGRLWITTNNGIACIWGSPERISFFSSRNNLQSPEYNFNASCSIEGKDLYFGGIRGINHINQAGFNPDSKAPAVRLISLNISDTVYSHGIPPTEPEVAVSRYSPHISGSVFSSDYMNTGLLTYSFLLEGYQSEWSKPSHDATFSYRNLPPGNYRLFVRCNDTYMNRTNPVQLLTITIRPALYTEWWFRALLTLALIGITILVVKRIQQTRYQEKIKEMERQNAIEKERLRISRDMHDEVGASLTRINILSELAKKEQNKPMEAQRIINQISEISGDVVDEMSEIIWAMNPRNDMPDNFTSYIRQYASSYLESASIQGRFHFPEEVPVQPMSSELRRNLFLIVKEALHNIVKHAGAGQVQMHLKFAEGNLEIIIADDGKGFVEKKIKRSGNGLVNMQKRMEDLGGRFDITSESGKGTRIELSVIFPQKDKSH
jgi:signal transduction histidine kinase